MVNVLFALGIVAVLAGLGMIGYGIPNYEFGLGNLLIGSGVTAILGGFIVIGLAVGVAQLRRIADLLRALPAVRVGRPGEPAEGAGARPRQGPGARAPMPPRPGAEAPGRAPPTAAAPPLSPRPLEPRPFEPRQPELRPAEPHPPTAHAAEAPVEVPVERPLPRFSRGEPRPEPPLVEETEEVTLSPRPAPRPYGSSLQRDLEFVPEPRREREADRSSDEPDRAFAPPPRAELPWRPSSSAASEPVVERSMFAGLRETRSEPVAPEHEATAPASDEEPVAPPVAAKPPRPEPAEARPVSILKSGVVDGMAYTLYSDGSIEAELPEGTVRFASINELRAHLETHEQLEKHS